MCSSDLALRFKKPLTATGNKRPTTDPLKNYYGNTYVYDLGAKLERHHFYYPDGTYQEFGDNSSTNLQEGTDFWDTDGHNCQIHEYPVKQRQIVVCHALMPLEIGQKAMQDNGNGPRPVTLLQGYHSLPK